MSREKLKLTNEQARDIVWGETDEFTEISNKVVGTSRWSTIYEIVVQRKSDGKYFKDKYRVGATESQDERAYEHTNPNFTEVFPVEKTITVYE